MTDIRTIPLNKLYLSPSNVRKTGAEEGIEALAQSIFAVGVLQNLIVQPGAKDGEFSVLAGGRRWRASKLLAKRKDVAEDWPVPCNVIVIEGDISSDEISLIENEMRASMHPADQFAAFKKLADEGQGNDTIAAHFGVPTRVVEQRLKLAAVSPKLVTVYREGEMTLEHLMAFTLTTDQPQQERIWKGLSKSDKEDAEYGSQEIRERILNKHINAASNKFAKFVGVAEYEKAGGQVVRDLFDDQDHGWLADGELLKKLTMEKLEELAEPFRNAGWKWIKILTEWGWAVEREYEKLPNPTKAGRERSGVIITIAQDGEALIKTGMMTKAEHQAASKAKTAEKGNSTKAAKKAEDKGLSQALVHNLTDHRTAALQASLAGNPKVALLAVVHAFAQTATEGFADSPLDVRAVRYKHGSEEAAKTEQAKSTDAAIKALQQSAPVDDAIKLWAWLAKKDQKELLEILALCAAASLNAVLYREPDNDEEDVADLIAEAVKLDMTKQWQPTAANFFDRLSSAQIVATVAAACGKKDAAEVQAKAKKSDMAKLAEQKLKGKGWLPEVLRS